MITRKYSGGNALIHTVYCTNQKLQTEAVTSVKHQIKIKCQRYFLKQCVLRHRLKVTLHWIDLSSRHRQRVPDSDCWS